MTEIKKLARLDHIVKELGKPQFDAWVKHAEKHVGSSPYLFRGQCAYRTALYSEIIVQYGHYKDREALEGRAARHATDQPLMWWDMVE